MATLRSGSGASDLDWVVIQYLHKNQCFEAEKSFLKHLASKQGVDVVPPKQQVLQDDYLKYLVMSKLFPESVEGEASYAASFRELYNFVVGLIDIYRVRARGQATTTPSRFGLAYPGVRPPCPKSAERRTPPSPLAPPHF